MGTPVRAAGGGRRRKNVAAPSSKSSSPKSAITRIAPPDELTGPAAISMWKTQSKILIERGSFALEDAPLLMTYCNSWALMLRADEVITEATMLSAGADGSPKKHPAVNVRNDCVSQLARLGSLLGLDPLSRARATGGAKPDSEEEDEFGDF